MTKILLHDTSNRTPIISQHTKINSSYRQQINSFSLFTISLLTSKDKIRDTEIKSNHALVIPFLTLERLNQSNTHANTDCRLNHPLCSTIGTLFTCTFTRIGHTSSARNWRGTERNTELWWWHNNGPGGSGYRWRTFELDQSCTMKQVRLLLFTTKSTKLDYHNYNYSYSYLLPRHIHSTHSASTST